MVLPNLLREQWRARTWCSSSKCPEPDLPLRICRKRTSYHLRLIDNFAHHLPTSTLLENIHFFICKYIYCIIKYICATTPSTYHWSKNTSSNWNCVQYILMYDVRLLLLPLLHTACLRYNQKAGPILDYIRKYTFLGDCQCQSGPFWHSFAGFLRFDVYCGVRDCVHCNTLSR